MTDSTMALTPHFTILWVYAKECKQNGIIKSKRMCDSAAVGAAAASATVADFVDFVIIVTNKTLTFKCTRTKHMLG